MVYGENQEISTENLSRTNKSSTWSKNTRETYKINCISINNKRKQLK